MKIKYVKGIGYKQLSAKDSKVVASELRKIQSETSVITPKIVVERASSPRSPLHRYFEWNNTQAAERYREWQARSLITAVYIVNADDPKSEPIRAFVNCSPSDEDGDDFMADRGYVFTPSIAGKQSYQNQVLLYARNQLIGWRRKFGAYKEFFGVVQAIDALK